MATISLNKRTLEKNVGKIDEKLKDRISMLGCPVEEENDKEISVDVSPNRPDLLSEQGIVRALLAFTGKKPGLKEYKNKKGNQDYRVIVEDSVKDVRPFTACAIVKNLSLDHDKIKEIIDIQEKLHTTYGRNRKKIAIGIYPLEKITLPITFKALPPNQIAFQPLEANSEMTAGHILENHPAGKEYKHLLEGKSKYPVFVDAHNKILSMPPIINSHDTGKVTEYTKEVFVECSGFNFSALNKCLCILTSLLSDMGGEVYSMTLKYGSKKLTTPDLTPEKMKIIPENVNKLLGLSLNEKDLKKCLEKMGHSYQNKTVLIPPYRADILHEVDLIEDVAIAYGYENFTPQIPQISTIGKESKEEILKSKIAEMLTGLNILETYSYCITNKEDECKKMNTNKNELIELMNAKTNYNVMRRTMLPSLMKVLGDNRDVDYPQRIFEMGRVFLKNGEITEKNNLAVASTNSNFTEAKQTLDYLFAMLGLEFSIKEDVHDSFIEGRTGKILLEKEEIGTIGEIHPKVLSNWRLSVPVSAFELDLEKLFKKLD